MAILALLSHIAFIFVFIVEAVVARAVAIRGKKPLRGILKKGPQPNYLDVNSTVKEMLSRKTIPQYQSTCRTTILKNSDVITEEVVCQRLDKKIKITTYWEFKIYTKGSSTRSEKEVRYIPLPVGK